MSLEERIQAAELTPPEYRSDQDMEKLTRDFLAVNTPAIDMDNASQEEKARLADEKAQRHFEMSKIRPNTPKKPGNIE